MKAKIQLKQFRRIQDHYQRELDSLTVELTRLNLQVTNLRSELGQIENRMEATQNQLASYSITVIDCRLGGQLLQKISEAWDQKFEELSGACERFEAQRAKVEKQMSRIKSLEKLIERKAELVDFEERRLQQLVADDQYLTSSLNRSNS
jgi:flagellar biosynthesis chaperone FliJ